MDEPNDLQMRIAHLKRDIRELVDLECMVYKKQIRDPWDVSGYFDEFFPPVTAEVIAAFEAKHGVVLPADYKAFFLEVENGRVGPDGGIIPFEENLAPGNCEFDEVDPTRPFKVTFSSIYGAIFIGHVQGDTGYNLLVLNGTDRGTVWAYTFIADEEDRLCAPYPNLTFNSPNRQSFLEWVEDWVARALPAYRLHLDKHEHPWDHVTAETATVDLARYQIASFEDFPQNVPNLSTIELYDNRIRTMQGLPVSLPALERLSLRKNQLESLEGFPREVPALKELLLSENNLHTLEGLPESFPSLERLSIIKNNLQTLDGFPPNVPKLKDLDLRENRLTSLEGIPTVAPKLEQIDIRDNPLESLRNLPRALPKLREILLDNTAITNFTGLPEDLPEFDGFSMDGVFLRNVVGLPAKLPKFDGFLVKNATVRSLHGASRAVLPYLILNEAFREAFRHGCEGRQEEKWSFYCFPVARQLVQACLDAAPPWPRDAPLPPEPPPLAAALDRLHATYARPPAELVTAFLADEARLTPGELERLAVEVPPAEVSALREKLPPDHPIFRVLEP